MLAFGFCYLGTIHTSYIKSIPLVKMIFFLLVLVVLYFFRVYLAIRVAGRPVVGKTRQRQCCCLFLHSP